MWSICYFCKGASFTRFCVLLTRCFLPVALKQSNCVPAHSSGKWHWKAAFLCGHLFPCDCPSCPCGSSVEDEQNKNCIKMGGRLWDTYRQREGEKESGGGVGGRRQEPSAHLPNLLLCVLSRRMGEVGCGKGWVREEIRGSAERKRGRGLRHKDMACCSNLERIQNRREGTDIFTVQTPPRGICLQKCLTEWITQREPEHCRANTTPWRVHQSARVCECVCACGRA